jgi:hypothetical protein
MTYREQLQQMLQEAAPTTILHAELTAVQVVVNKPREQVVKGLLKILKPTLHQDTKWFIGMVLEKYMDESMVGPLIKAANAPGNAKCSGFFLSPLIKYDCTKHLSTVVNIMLKCDGADENMLTCIPVIQAMKGPFEPVELRRNIRKLLGKGSAQPDSELQLAAEAFKAQAADFLMAKYFNHYFKVYWKDWGKPK